MLLLRFHYYTLSWVFALHKWNFIQVWTALGSVMIFCFNVVILFACSSSNSRGVLIYDIRISDFRFFLISISEAIIISNWSYLICSSTHLLFLIIAYAVIFHFRHWNWRPWNLIYFCIQSISHSWFFVRGTSTIIYLILSLIENIAITYSQSTLSCLNASKDSALPGDAHTFQFLLNLTNNPLILPSFLP